MAKCVYKIDLQILHQNDFGFIGRCLSSKEIHFNLGTVFSFMHQQGFFALYRSLKKINDQLADNLVQFPTGKKVMLRTPVDNFLLCLSPIEFQQVMDLFDQAALKLQLLGALEEVEKMN